MKKNTSSLYSILLIAAFLCGIFYFMMPQSYDKVEAPLSEFSTKRALEKVKEISVKPHFVGSENHETVARLVIYRLWPHELDWPCFHAWHGRIFSALIFIRRKDTIIKVT